MRTRLDGLAASVALGGAGLLALGMACHAAGARINTTRSIPVGLYWTSSAPVAKGAYVQFCPPPAAPFTQAKQRGYIGVGFCPGGYGLLMKRVLAAKGETVFITDEGVRVAGKLVPLSAPLAADRAGRPMPRYRASVTLAESEVLLMSDVNAASFDARYFGPIRSAQIISVIRPVLTW